MKSLLFVLVLSLASSLAAEDLRKGLEEKLPLIRGEITVVGEKIALRKLRDLAAINGMDPANLVSTVFAIHAGEKEYTGFNSVYIWPDYKMCTISGTPIFIARAQAFVRGLEKHSNFKDSVFEFRKQKKGDDSMDEELWKMGIFLGIDR